MKAFLRIDVWKGSVVNSGTFSSVIGRCLTYTCTCINTGSDSDHERSLMTGQSGHLPGVWKHLAAYCNCRYQERFVTTYIVGKYVDFK